MNGRYSTDESSSGWRFERGFSGLYDTTISFCALFGWRSSSRMALYFPEFGILGETHRQSN